MILPTFTSRLVLLVLLAPDEPRDDPAAEARRLYRLGDYPAAERALERVLEALPAGASEERAARLAELAEIRVLQGAGTKAVEDIGKALAESASPLVRRSAVFVCLQVHRYREALPHLEALLAEAPEDPSLRFSRGIVRSREGDFEAALEDLAFGLRLEPAARDARFELALALAKLRRPREALVRLREIIEEDPYDAEACHQASRQLLSLREEPASRTAALLVRWFEAIRENEGASSRDRHLVFAGKPVEAALERAARAERLARHDRVLAEIERARALRPGAPEVEDFAAAFWGRRGFAAPPGAKELEEALRLANASGDEGRAASAARLLLAREPRSIPALTGLLESARDPSLIVPRLHFLARLAAAEPASGRWRDDLAAARRVLEGGR